MNFQCPSCKKNGELISVERDGYTAVITLQCETCNNKWNAFGAYSYRLCDKGNIITNYSDLHQKEEEGKMFL